MIFQLVEKYVVSSDIVPLKDVQNVFFPFQLKNLGIKQIIPILINHNGSQGAMSNIEVMLKSISYVLQEQLKKILREMLV